VKKGDTMIDTQDLFSNALSLDRLCRAWERWHVVKRAIGQTVPTWSMVRLEETLLEAQAAWAAYNQAQLEEQQE